MIRTLVLAKQAHRELNQLVHPNMVRPLKVGGNVIANRVVFAVLAFVFLYFMSIVTLVFVQLAQRTGFHDLASPPSSPASTMRVRGWGWSGRAAITGS